MNGRLLVSLLTSVLDLVGLLLLVVALVVLVWPLSVSAALAAGGASVLAISLLISHRKAAR